MVSRRSGWLPAILVCGSDLRCADRTSGVRIGPPVCGSDLRCADRTSGVRIGPEVCRYRTPHAQSRARSPGALHFTLGQRKMMGNQPLRHRDSRSLRTELGPYAAGHASCFLPIPVVTDRNPLGSRRADGFRLWWPRCAKARTGDVFCCADSTLGPTQSKDRGVPKNCGSWRNGTRIRSNVLWLNDLRSTLLQQISTDVRI